VVLRVVLAVVDPDHDGQVGALSGRGQQHLARAPFQVQRRLVTGAELASGLDHNVGPSPPQSMSAGSRLYRTRIGLPLTVIDSSECATSAFRRP
jgi:hypothetical protein